MTVPQLTVRLRLALAIVATGLITALLVVATVLYAFQRFEHETTFQRANAFLERIATNVDLLDLHERLPQEVNAWMRSVMLYEPDSQLYLLDAQGAVLSSTGQAKLAPEFKVALAPVQAAAHGASGPAAMPYVMGDDPERMSLDTVVAARLLRRAVIHDSEPVSGYLYLVSRRQGLPGSRWDALRNSFAFPVLLLLLGIVALTTGLAAAMIAAVTRPLQRLTAALAGISLTGLENGAEPGRAGLWATAAGAVGPARRHDEFGQLGSAFEMMLTTLRKQWETLRRLDHFRREGVSNLSHDLRSPLTATLACLETLEVRWAEPPQPAPADRHLVAVALRNARHAAHLVQALGDLAKLDEPQFKLHREIVDASELLDDIGVRFTARAAQKGITLEVQHAGRAPDNDADLAAPFAALDVELFERAIANLVDNALKFCAAGADIVLSARQIAGRVEVRVRDTGPGIAAAEQPHLFDRFYQSRVSAAPAASEGGKGLGLAIVKRIVELHGGTVALTSQRGRGTEVLISLAPAHPAAPQEAATSDSRHAAG